jgi:peroxiredoxin
MKKLKINLAVLALLALSTGLSKAQDNIDFTIQLLNGEEVRFSEFNTGGITLINFWALWCKPCRIEMKELEKLYSKYKESGFEIVGINQDTPRSLAKVESFVSSQNLSFNIGLDPNRIVADMFNVQAIPHTVLFDRDGKVVYQSTGYLPGDEFKLEKEIKSLLEQNN